MVGADPGFEGGSYTGDLGALPPEAEEFQIFEMLICMTILTHNIKIDG